MLLLLGLLILVFVQVTLNALTLAFTPPNSSIRLAVLPLVLSCMFVVLSRRLEATEVSIWASLLGASSISFSFQYIDTALITRWTAATCGPISRPSGGKPLAVSSKRDANTTVSAWHRLRFGYWAAVTTRNLGSSFELPGIPCFDPKNPAYVPSRSKFLQRKAISLLMCYIILDLLTYSSKSDQNRLLFNPSRVSLLRAENLTVEQMAVRAGSTLGFWLSLYCVIQAFMGFLAILSVGLGIDKVSSWRPGFGNISESYTLRRFWGVFWHRYQQQKMSSPASFLTARVFRLSRGTITSRYTHLFLTFFLSGVFHAAAELPEEVPWQSSGAIRFFCTQAVGIIVEDAFLALFPRKSPRFLPAVAGLLCGYFWVAAFLVWSTPVWIYPALYANQGQDKDRVVPCSIVGRIHGDMKKYLGSYGLA